MKKVDELHQEIQERLELLLSSNQISELEWRDTLHTIENIENYIGTLQNKDVMGLFATHLAIALARIRRGEGIIDQAPEIQEVVQQHPDLNEKALLLLKNLLGEDMHIPAGEIGFITLYFNLLQQSP